MATHRRHPVALAAVLLPAALLLASTTGCAAGTDGAPTTVPANRSTTASNGTSTPAQGSVTGASTSSASSVPLALWPPSGVQGDWQQDPARTALRFTRDYLGYTEADRVVEQSLTDATGTRARVGVGSPGEGPRPIALGTLLLQRTGGPGTGWVVVGAEGGLLSITTPAAGQAVSWPVTVTGRITGVDESLHVQVLAVAADGTRRLLGEVQGIPAGGEDQPWSATVALRGTAPATGTALTVTVATGGHLQQVERFTVTGVRQG